VHAQFCVQHKELSHVDIRSRRCSAPNCSRQPSFYDPNQAASLFCSHHAHAASTLHTHTHTFHIHTPPLDHLQREGEIGEAGGGNEGVRGVELVRPGRRTCGFSMCSTLGIFGRVLSDGSFRHRCLIHKDAEDHDLSRQTCSVAGCSSRKANRALVPGLGGHERLCLKHAHVVPYTPSR